MPTYQVTERGFYGGQMYDPAGKRRTLHVEKPFKKCPSWLKPVKAESAAVVKKRNAANSTNAKQVADGNKDIIGASFLDDPGASGSNVETL